MFEVDLWGDDVAEAVAALPVRLSADFARIVDALEVSPATVGRPLVPTNPGGSRVVVFGPESEGQAVFMIGRHDDDRRVTILQVIHL